MHISITIYRTLHILMTSQFDSLKRLLESHRNATKFDPTKRNELYGLNVWIIHVIGEENRESAVTLVSHINDEPFCLSY